jgi:hypothetical protein
MINKLIVMSKEDLTFVIVMSILFGAAVFAWFMMYIG